MTALVRYTLANLFLSQRYLPPTFSYLVLLAVLTSNDSGPLVSVYAASAASLLACGLWLAVAVVNAEDPGHRSIVLVTVRRPADVSTASATVALLYNMLLGIVGLVYPLISGSHTITAHALAIGAAAQLTCASVATGLGLLCSRPLLPRTGVATLAGVGAVLGVLLLKWLPPVSPLLRKMTGGSAADSSLVPFAGFAALGLLSLGGCGVLFHRLARRRD